MQSTTTTLTSAVPPPLKHARKQRGAPKPSKQPKRIRVAPSQIANAGMGLYMMEGAKVGECIARYSGEPMTRAESTQRGHSHYKLQVHSNLFLDAADPVHFEGRYINDARHTQFKTNARFAANYTTNTCSNTGFKWVRIYATRRIRAGEEVFLNYGKSFWTGFENDNDAQATVATSSETQRSTPLAADPICNDQSPPHTPTAHSSMWAASAYIPGDTPPSPLVINDPAQPRIMGHIHPNQLHTMTTSPQLSPITPHSPPNNLNGTHLHLNLTVNVTP